MNWICLMCSIIKWKYCKVNSVSVFLSFILFFCLSVIWKETEKKCYYIKFYFVWIEDQIRVLKKTFHSKNKQTLSLHFIFYVLFTYVLIFQQHKKIIFVESFKGNSNNTFFFVVCWKHLFFLFHLDLWYIFLYFIS